MTNNKTQRQQRLHCETMRLSGSTGSAEKQKLGGSTVADPEKASARVFLEVEVVESVVLLDHLTLQLARVKRVHRNTGGGGSILMVVGVGRAWSTAAKGCGYVDV